MTRILFLFISAVTATLSLRAQTPTPVVGPAAPLRLAVVAIDGAGVPVTDLKPSEFEVWISGYRVPIVDVFAPMSERGRTVVLLLDNVAVAPPLALRVKEAARLFVKRMTPVDRMAVVALHGGAMADTGDRAVLIQAIDDYHVQGFPFRLEDAGEHVLNTIESLAGQIAESSDGGKTIVAIGAGWMFDAPMPPPGLRNLQREWVAAMRSMAATNTSLYVIDPGGVGMARGGTDGGTRGFARETGGHAFLNTNDTEGVVDQIWAEAGAHYVLAMTNPPVRRSADLRELEVKVLRKGVTVRARRGIRGRD